MIVLTPLVPPPTSAVPDDFPWLCEDCGFSSSRRGLAVHRVHQHVCEPLDTYEVYPIPWSEIYALDRGWSEACWLAHVTPRTVRRIAQDIVEIRDGIRTGGSIVAMHLCEEVGFSNLCVRPEHIQAGSRRENSLHSWSNMIKAGLR